MKELRELYSTAASLQALLRLQTSSYKCLCLFNDTCTHAVKGGSFGRLYTSLSSIEPSEGSIRALVEP
jgi:hypothetical protein